MSVAMNMADKANKQVRGRQYFNKIGSSTRKDTKGGNPREQDPNLSRFIMLTSGHLQGNFFIAPLNVIKR